MLTEHLPWIIAGIVVLALVVGGVVLSRTDSQAYAGLLRRGRARPPRDHFRPDDDEPPAPLKRAAVIVNPTKFTDLVATRQRLTAAFLAAGWAEPTLAETTVADPGQGQAERALRDGVDLVCSLGGDGTVRAVASALLGSDTPLGILPAGTGNLLARNLDLPVDDLDAAVTVALTGRNRRIDVGDLVVGDEESVAGADADASGAATAVSAAGVTGTVETHHFLVMAGMGMDAAIMAGTNEILKARVGWPAYMVSGLKHLVSPEFRVRVQVDGQPAFRRRARMVVIGNCGRLLGGLVLMPNARVDDGQLDAVIASPRGVVGWVPVATRVATRQRKGHPTLDHHTCREVTVRSDRPLPVQIDGDVIGEARTVRAVVRPGVLTVRVGPA
ncbi:diacylglycerol/lipid kinase family protein [Terracoccus luteus]|uniref:Diacylglycerol kinase family enzyme n=1 Tax=Terracoccus luteus TaxID=53356 RepID=A0A495Y067_9MICO|nr:diacylglycerol kinase family protein [Terracoccus luteus]MBB2987538.1 diacylglycerol kinase family enzyme [Terracoccus luteus]MCP2173189.1 diacylglycerol kinase family enzyme [Terracoccus luteus]RKT79937.1 diacylglycerol kinase family enzyme [Terracoccus luteus]